MIASPASEATAGISFGSDLALWKRLPICQEVMNAEAHSSEHDACTVEVAPIPFMLGHSSVVELSATISHQSHFYSPVLDVASEGSSSSAHFVENRALRGRREYREGKRY